MTGMIRQPLLTAPTRDMHANWAANNPILPEGVLAMTKGRLGTGSLEALLGDGVSAYDALDKISGIECGEKPTAFEWDDQHSGPGNDQLNYRNGYIELANGLILNWGTQVMESVK